MPCLCISGSAHLSCTADSQATLCSARTMIFACCQKGSLCPKDGADQRRHRSDQRGGGTLEKLLCWGAWRNKDWALCSGLSLNLEPPPIRKPCLSKALSCPRSLSSAAIACTASSAWEVQMDYKSDPLKQARSVGLPIPVRPRAAPVVPATMSLCAFGSNLNTPS